MQQTQKTSPTLSSYNPANDELIWQGQVANQSEVNNKVAQARLALTRWSLTSADERIAFLHRYQQVLQQHDDELSHAISLETGKPHWEAKTEVSAMIQKIPISIDAYSQRNKETHHQQNAHSSHIRYKPHGVMAVLGPFNFPGHLPNGHIIPALLAGNTVVFKPSEFTPMVAEKMHGYWQQAGLPSGVISLVQGASETGQALLNSNIDGVLFTGSYATGRKINQHFADRPEILLALEMGGNSPLVIDQSLNNIDTAVYHTLVSAYITAGQRCSCARRLILPDNALGDDFLTRLIEQTQRILVGTFSQSPQPFMGPVIDKNHALKHLEQQQILIKQGAKALLPMQSLKSNTGFLSPGILDMSAVKHCRDSELFAPLLQVHRYRDFEHAIELANNTQYGLAAGFFGEDPKRYHYFFQRIRAGIINWNRPLTGASSQGPFGGVGHSGNHRPSAYFAADYCSYPIASLEQEQLQSPEQTLPGINGRPEKNS